MNDRPPGQAAAAPRGAQEDVHQRIGQLTRTLHTALRELGYDRNLASVREHLPDARDRLSYIARVTGEAAEKVLNSVDEARLVQKELSVRATSLKQRWQAIEQTASNHGGGGLASPSCREMFRETSQFFDAVNEQAEQTNVILTEIMMAQEFHDLTGQVIRRVLRMATDVEEQLITLLLETTPPESRRKVEPAGTTAALEGPAVRTKGRDDVVTDQAGVDDLLASLGF